MEMTTKELRLAIKQASQTEVFFLDIYLERKDADSEHNYITAMDSTQALIDMAQDNHVEIFYHTA